MAHLYISGAQKIHREIQWQQAKIKRIQFTFPQLIPIVQAKIDGLNFALKQMNS